FQSDYGGPEPVAVLAALPNGDVVAAGPFTTIGTQPLSTIARWDGNAWLPLGARVNGSVHALAVTPNGNLLVGGDFTTAGGLPALHCALWDGANWSPLGQGIPAIPYVFGVLN